MRERLDIAADTLNGLEESSAAVRPLGLFTKNDCQFREGEPW